jgi:hypothetical protein
MPKSIKFAARIWGSHLNAATTVYTNLKKVSKATYMPLERDWIFIVFFSYGTPNILCLFYIQGAPEQVIHFLKPS